MLYKENKNILVWRELHKTIQNKTAVFWLQYPFCSTSACQLAPLGKGRESRDCFGRKYWIQENAIEQQGDKNQNIQSESTGTVSERSWGWHSSPFWSHPYTPGLGSSAGEGNSHSREIPSWAFGLSTSCVTAEGKSPLRRCSYILVPKKRNPCSSIWGKGGKNIFWVRGWEKKKNLQRTVWIRECQPTGGKVKWKFHFKRRANLMA